MSYLAVRKGKLASTPGILARASLSRDVVLLVRKESVRQQSQQKPASHSLGSRMGVCQSEVPVTTTNQSFAQFGR